MASVFITGVAGFLGSNVAKILLRQGFDVYGCDNFVTSTPETIPDGVLFYEMDIRDLSPVPRTDVIIHTAAIARSAWPDSDEILSTNISGSLNVFDLAQKNKSRLVNCSSCVSAYPELNDYSLSKHVAETVAMMRGAVSLRFSNIYGEGQSKIGAYPNVLASWLLQRETQGFITVDGDGSQTRDFIHVTDAANAIVCAMYNESMRGSWVDICTGVQTPLIDIAEMFDCNISFGPKRRGDRHSFPQDPTVARIELKWTHSVDLQTGLREII